ncbi:MAG: hypothetical protein BAA04_00035 [Firmicutes bacterium ZCTH02-B6]|nr:MAG: hypothetical protein BAA04_00035 [Firmicutes bacterium ZCTH02-B6]
MTDERLQILRMVQEGKVSAEEAAKLLEALDEGKSTGTGAPRRRNRFLRVRVVDGEKTKVNVNLPLELAWVALRFIPKDALKVGDSEQPLDPEELKRLLEQGLEGKIIDVEDNDGKTRVEVVVE